MTLDTCTNCGIERRKWKQWFYRDAMAWCPTCAPADMKAARSERIRAQVRRRKPRPNKNEVADRAARVVMDDGVARRDALARFGIGPATLCKAIDRLRRQRAA